MVQSITKAIIPAAGLGTRFLPATKAMPKEMLPVVDKPVIQYVVEEAVDAGLTQILMVTGRNKNTLENHFDRAFELESKLATNGDQQKAVLVSKSTDLADIHYVRQGDALGLGHAITKARTFVGNEPFAVLLGDEIIHESDEFLNLMVKIAEKSQGNVIGLFEVPIEELHKYGVAEYTDTEVEGVVQISSLVEKPALGDEPSRLAVVGRYVLQPEIFDVLDELEPGYGGEIQLTDALDIMAKHPEIAGPVIGVKLTGKRLDMGNQFSFLKATIELALLREDFGDDFKTWIKKFAEQL